MTKYNFHYAFSVFVSQHLQLLKTLFISLNLCISQIIFPFSFPGGKKDSTDKTITDAALREAEEEISLKRESIRVFHSFGPFTSRVLTIL